MSLEIKFVDVNEISPDPMNSKLHPAEQIEQIKESIQEFGFNDPVALDKDRTIIEGNGRLIAAIELGMKKIPVIYLNDLTEQQRTAYSLIHNKLTMNTGFELGILETELDNIIGIDMSKYSFSLDMDTYFDESIIPDKKDKITVVLDKESAKDLRGFLEDNDIKYKEKNVR